MAASASDIKAAGPAAVSCPCMSCIGPPVTVPSAAVTEVVPAFAASNVLVATPGPTEPAAAVPVETVSSPEAATPEATASVPACIWKEGSLGSKVVEARGFP